MAGSPQSSLLPNYWVIIPALNEEESLPIVLNSLKKLKSPPERVIVVDNGSQDNTAQVAFFHGATVLREHQKGYGISCQKAIQWIQIQPEHPEVVVFMDADHSDDPQDILNLLQEVSQGYFVVFGSRTLGKAEKGSLSLIQFYGNQLACYLMKLLFHCRFTDLGPLRAVHYPTLLSLNMEDKNFGWTIEMQCKVAIHKIPFKEIPVNYRPRLFGKSKVSRNFFGSIQAGIKILYLVFYYFLKK